MKVRRNLLIALSLLSLSANAQRIKGSDTVLPVAQQTAERFMNQHPDARVTVTGGGTGVGISALMDNTTDIAMASRPIKFSEKMKTKEAGQEVDEVIVAYDALAVVVHPSNPVKQLTRQQPGRYLPRKNHQLEASGRRRPQNSCLFPRNLFGNLRILQGKRAEKQELYGRQPFHARHRCYHPVRQPDEGSHRVRRAGIRISPHQNAFRFV